MATDHLDKMFDMEDSGLLASGASVKSVTYEHDFENVSSNADLALVVEERKLHVAKSILTVASPVFSSMLGGDFLESSLSEISLPGKLYSDVKELLLCLYPNVQKPISSDNAMQLLPLVDEYQILNLKQRCEAELTTKAKALASTNELLIMLNFSSRYLLGTLKRICMQRLSEKRMSDIERCEHSSHLSTEIQLEMLRAINTKLNDTVDKLTNADTVHARERFLQTFVPNGALPKLQGFTDVECGKVKIEVLANRVGYFLVSSQHVFVWGLPWVANLWTAFDEEAATYNVSFVLNCEYREPFNCAVIANFRLISQTSHKGEHRSVCDKFKFSRTNPSHGVTEFATWTEIANPCNGFVDNNKVLFEVCFLAKKPVFAGNVVFP